MITAKAHNTQLAIVLTEKCHDITNNSSEQNVAVIYTDSGNESQSITLPPNGSISVCALEESVVVFGSGSITTSVGSECDANVNCDSNVALFLNYDENSGQWGSSNACSGPSPSFQAWSFDIQNISLENTTSIIGKQILNGRFSTTGWQGDIYTNWAGYYAVGASYYGAKLMALRIDNNGFVTEASLCSTPTPTPTPTNTTTLTPIPSPTPSPTPSSSAPATIYKYIMNPCDEESPNFTAASNVQRTINATYTCTGSAYAEDNYTIISTSLNSYVTWIGDLTICEGGGGGCLITGTQVEMHDGTFKNIEDLSIGDALMSRDIETAPDSDDYDVLTNWSHSNPKIETGLTQVVGKTGYWKNSIYNFNSGLLRSSKDHMHFIKRGDSYKFIKSELVQVGDFLIDKDNNLIEITSAVRTHGNFQVWKIDVESLDMYIANGIVTHNDKPGPR